jgi:hypothetical protein
MFKRVIVGGLAAIVVGAAGVGTYEAVQNHGLVDRTAQVETVANGNGYARNIDDSVTQAEPLNRGNRVVENGPTAGNQSNSGSVAQSNGGGRGAGSAALIPQSSAGMRGRQNQAQQ